MPKPKDRSSVLHALVRCLVGYYKVAAQCGRDLTGEQKVRGNFEFEVEKQSGADAVYAVFKGGRLADLQRYIYITNERGDRRHLVHFVAPKVPGEEAIFYFARYDEKGALLFNAKNRELLFNLTNVEVSLVANFRVDLSHLLIDGEISF